MQKGPAVSRFEAAHKCFSELFEADVARLYAGETLVVRSARREEAQGGVTTPVWILVTEGRGVVSTSRFLYRVAGAWAEAFAAPDYLLRPAYLGELQAIVSRALDAPAVVSRERIFAPGSDFKAGPKTILQPLPGFAAVRRRRPARPRRARGRAAAVPLRGERPCVGERRAGRRLLRVRPNGAAAGAALTKRLFLIADC